MPQWKAPHKSKLNDECESGITEIQIANKDQSQSNVTANRLYFYGDITDDSVIGWNRQLDDVSKNLKVLQTMYDLSAPPPIHIYIQSNGGEIFAALSTLGRLIELRNKGFDIHTIVDGFCASGATLISVGGSKRFIRPYACMLIHQLSSEFWGTYEEFKDEKQNVDLIMTIIKKVYKDHTTLDPKELDEILTHDLYLSPQECLDKGLVDEVM